MRWKLCERGKRLQYHALPLDVEVSEDIRSKTRDDHTRLVEHRSDMNSTLRQRFDLRSQIILLTTKTMEVTGERVLTIVMKRIYDDGH